MIDVVGVDEYGLGGAGGSGKDIVVGEVIAEGHAFDTGTVGEDDAALSFWQSGISSRDECHARE